MPEIPVKKPFYKRWWLWLIVAVALIGAAAFIIRENSTEPATAGNSATANLPGYDVVSVDDQSSGGAVRWEYHVVVSEKCTPEQLQDISAQIVEQAKTENPFNAAILLFYDYPEYIGSGATLGKSIYAPHGKVADAIGNELGDYSEMQFNHNFKEKDWDLRLTPEQVTAWKAWQDAYDEAFRSLEEIDEEAISEQVAEQTGLSLAEVNHLLLQQAEWAVD